MSINSIEYIIFTLLGTVIYYVIPKKIRLYYILVLSVIFYALWSVPNTILMILSALATYFIGMHCEGTALTGENVTPPPANKN